MLRRLAIGLSVLAVQSQAPEDFASLFREYRVGDADRAVATFKTWHARRVGRDAQLPEGQDDAWSRAALALFHREAILGSAAWATHRERYLSLIEDLTNSVPAEARELRTFCRDFHLTDARGGNWAWLYRRFPGDPIVTLRHGQWLEYWMPRIDSTRSTEYGFMDGPVVEITSHGKFGREAPEAIATLRKALEQAPEMVEARVRLGRVLWQLDRREEAARELRQAMSEASGREPTFAYLAGLFLGQVYEEQKRTEEAEQAYRRGLAAHATGQVIPMLLGRLLVATGRDAEGWSIVSGAVGRPASSVDPWTVYFIDKARGPEFQARWKALRARLPRPER